MKHGPLHPLTGPPLRRILIATDLSPAADRPVDRAALLPLAARARVDLVHVIPDPAVLRRAGGKLLAIKRALSEISRRLSDTLAANGVHGARVTTVIRNGSPFGELLQHAEHAQPDLTVVGRHGGGGFRSLLIGSTAEKVLRGRACPVLVVSRDGRVPYQRPLIALDPQAPAATQPLEFGLRILDRGVRRIDLVSAYEVVHEGYIRAAGASEQSIHEMRREHAGDCHRAVAALTGNRIPPGVKGVPVIKRGDARRVVRDIADRRSSDIIVVGTSARRGLARVFLGSVATDVMRSATIDVLIVPPAGRGSSSKLGSP